MREPFLEANRRWSRKIDGAARTLGRRDGNYAFVTHSLPSLLKPDMRVLDVGGGKNPGIDASTKKRLKLTIHGLDISASELARAPADSYDDVIVGNVATVALRERYDLVFSCAVMEHVKGASRAFANLASALAPGGTVAHFVPNARAPFAVVNRLLGAERARAVLFAAFPASKQLQGFAAYYESCLPSRFLALSHENGLQVLALTTYFSSGYASFFLPFHALDVARQLLLMKLRASDWCESFSLIARKAV